MALDDGDDEDDDGGDDDDDGGDYDGDDDEKEDEEEDDDDEDGDEEEDDDDGNHHNYHDCWGSQEFAVCGCSERFKRVNLVFIIFFVTLSAIFEMSFKNLFFTGENYESVFSKNILIILYYIY